jgi:opacity protein-like surface antigen
VGGIGLEYLITNHWAAQAEVRYYYSTTSTTKQYMRNKDYRYNSTTAVQLGINYIF